MGFLDKIKNLFTEEVEEEEVVRQKVVPQKKETKSGEVTLPKRETPVINNISSKTEELPVTDSKVAENNEKFVFPVYFDDKDFDDLEKPKVKEKPKKIEEPKVSKKEPYNGAKVTIEPEKKKVFTPSPIISPVYGILDKNYSKDDITTKQERKNNNIIGSLKQDNLTIDDIRNKAYGTLEDDLEITMSYDLTEINEKPKHEAQNQEALEIFNELDFEKIEQKEKEDKSFQKLERDILLEKENIVDDDTEELARQLEEQKKKLEEISQYITENEIPREEKVTVPDEDVEKVNSVSEEPTEDSNLNDSELFDLIDSMYEKEDEE